MHQFQLLRKTNTYLYIMVYLSNYNDNINNRPQQMIQIKQMARGSVQYFDRHAAGEPHPSLGRRCDMRTPKNGFGEINKK